MKTAIAKLKDGTEVEVGYTYPSHKYPISELGTYGVNRVSRIWTLNGERLESYNSLYDILNIDDVLHDLDIPNTSYVVKTLANTKWSELPESKLRAMYDLLTGE